MDLLTDGMKIENTLFVEVMTLKDEKNRVIAKYIEDFVINGFNQIL